MVALHWLGIQPNFIIWTQEKLFTSVAICLWAQLINIYSAFSAIYGL